MTSTNYTTICARISQCLAATALMAGIAIGSAATAGAERVWDLDAYDKCIATWPPGLDPHKQGDEYIRFEKGCCANSGGDWDANIGECVAPPAEAENLPQEPGQTTTPPVLQNPPGQPSNPLIPVPRGPNSGTVAP